MAEISYLLSHFNATCDVICVICVKRAEGYNLLGGFESALFKVVIYKRNLTIFIFI